MNSIVEAIASAAVTKPNMTAVIAEGQQITYSELWKEIQGFAAFIQLLGYSKSNRIITKAKHAIWYIVACFGAHLAGCVFVPVEKTIGAEGLKNVAEQLSASIIIADSEIEGVRCEVIASTAVRSIAQSHYDSGSTFQFPQSGDLSDILFTTGTTGKSKGVMLSHKAEMAVAENMQHCLQLRDGNVYLIPGPMNHSGGLRHMYLCMMTGTTVVLLDGYTNVKKLFEYIRNYYVTGVYMPPSAVRMVLLLAEKELEKYADQIQYIYTASAPFPEADKERLIKILPHSHLYFAYGCSEAARATIIDYAKISGRDCCVGKPTIHSRVLIVDDDRHEIQSSVNKQGLIAITGDTVMEGYFNEPELTARTLVDGVVYTNDIGYIDEEGYLYVLGRRDDVINVGGLKIAPTEVENIALRFPGVAECVCYPVKDKISGVAPKLNIVEERGMKVDIPSLREHMLRALEAYKVPKMIEKVGEIPKTANGKIDRKSLK